MRLLGRVMLFVVVLALPLFAARGADRTVEAGPAVLSVGDQAPPFTLPGSDGRTYKLSDYRGKQAVVIAWFAKAFTGG